MLGKLLVQVNQRLEHLDYHSRIEGWPEHMRSHIVELHRTQARIIEYLKQQEERAKDTEG